ncbi:hypothetical protein HDU86_002720 [Geranomyces michiganensis]|nr:hypothetical protein HDU86_002720 [Geranomyces michiganensis]
MILHLLRVLLGLVLVNNCARAVPGKGSNLRPFAIPLENPLRIAARADPTIEDHGPGTPSILRRSIIEEDIKDVASVILSYFGKVTFGTSTPAQTFTLLFDTGSFQLWVRSSKCTSPACSGLPKFYGSKSSTYASTGEAAPKVKYADGTTVFGVYSTDKIDIKGLAVNNLKFMEITETDDPNGAAFDGIMGMCWPEAGYPTTYFQTLMTSGRFDTPAMSYYINSDYDTGGVVMGGVDTARFSGNIQWVPSFGYASDGSGRAPFQFFMGLTVGMAYISPNNVTTKVPWTAPTNNYLSVFDTGTSYAILPRSVAAALHDNIPGISMQETSSGATYFAKYDPTFLSKCGKMQFSFVGESGALVNLTLIPEVYMHLFQDSKTGTKFWQSLIVGNDGIKQPTTPKGPVVAAILGNAFLQVFYTVFDYGNNRTGFALASRDGSATPVLTALDSSVVGTGSAFTDYWPPDNGGTGDGGSLDQLTQYLTYVYMGLPAFALFATTIFSCYFSFQ